LKTAQSSILPEFPGKAEHRHHEDMEFEQAYEGGNHQSFNMEMKASQGSIPDYY
jgi:hypothetical protein